MLRHFRGSILFALVAFALAGWYGWSQTHSLTGLGEALWIVLVLSVLEVSLSFDNAVVNATVLKDMDPLWQRRFLTWGMVIAVWGMYVLFPLAIVAIAAEIGPFEAIHLSLRDPAHYQSLVSSAHGSIAGFGGAFLGMVGLKFFFDEEKDVHWVRAVERFLRSASTVPAAEIAVVLLSLWAVSTRLPAEEAHTFLVSGLFGLVTFIAVDGLGTVLKKREDRMRKEGKLASAGFGGFLYLNVLDASFSLDAVIGAFALSNNMVIIALGLSIGGMFVRSMTLMLVNKGTLAAYRYIEHGAFWAILALAVIMLLSAEFEIPETVTGLIGAVLIGFSLLWSVRHNRSERARHASGG